jgi:hypothetical protein
MHFNFGWKFSEVETTWRREWEGNIKTDLREITTLGENPIAAFFNMVMSLLVLNDYELLKEVSAVS